MSCSSVKTTIRASVLAVAVMSVGCGHSPTTPIPPYQPPTPTPTPTLNYTISGAVTELVDGEPVPVEGVVVREYSTNQSVVTDAKGVYAIAGIKVTHSSIVATKEGYGTFATTFTGTIDTKLDVRIVRFVYYTLSGMAYELTSAGRVPIAGIVLYCDGCGSPVGHTFVTTDAEGLYSFSYVLAGVTEVQVDGQRDYQYVGPNLGRYAVQIQTPGDTRFDFEFARKK